MTFFLHIAKEICLRSCNKHISIYRNALIDWVLFWSVPLILWKAAGYTLQYKLASCLPWHVMWWTQLVYFIIRGRLGSDSHLGLVATIDSLLWNFSHFCWSLYQWCQQYLHGCLSCAMQRNISNKKHIILFWGLTVPSCPCNRCCQSCSLKSSP